MNLQTELNFGGVQETSRIAYHENKREETNGGNGGQGFKAWVFHKSV